MIYRTDCGCIASYPEPRLGEYDDQTDYDRAHADWAAGWERTVVEHCAACPSSAYYRQRGRAASRNRRPEATR